MSSNNISLTKRGRIPKVHRMANTGVKSKTDVDDLEDKLLQQSLLDSFSVEKYSKKDTFTKSGELKEEFNQRIYEVETIQKMVHMRLKNKELEIERLVQKNTELSEIVSKLEADKLEAINDNTRLARRIRGMVDNKEVDNKEVSDLKVEKSKLLRKIEEKEDKVSKLVELIKPLRERVTEQEKFKEQLNQASGENKSLHVVNEEFKEALDNKEKELQIVKTLLDKTKQTIGSEEMRLTKERKQLKEKELTIEETQLRISQDSKSFEEFKLQVTAEKLKWTDEKSAIEVEKKTIQDDKMTMDRQQADLNQLKITLREEKHTLSADKKAMQDEQKELDEDKMMLHIEWGDIWTKKNQLEKLANSQDADINVQEKQEQLDKLVTENKSIQAKIDLKNAKLEDLFQKYNLLEDKLNVSQEGSRKEIADIKALCSEIKSAKKAQKKDLESKDMKLTSLQDEMKSTKSYYEKKMDYRSKQKIMLKKEIRQKNEEIVQLKESLNSTISNKRKQMDKQKEVPIISKKLKPLEVEKEGEPSSVYHNVGASSPELDNLDGEQLLDSHLPSDLETGIVDTEDANNVGGVVNSNNVSYDSNAVKIANGVVTNTSSTSFEAGIAGTDLTSAVKDLSAWKQIEDFESFIKNKRIQDLSQVVGKGREDKVCNAFPDIMSEKSKVIEASTVITDVVKQRDMTVTTTAKHKGKSVRDIFNDSDDSEGGGTDASEPTTSKEGNRSKVESRIPKVKRIPVMTNVEPPPPCLTPELTTPALPIVSNSPAQTSSRSWPERPFLAVRDINTLTMSSHLGQDVLIPNFADIDPAMEISEDGQAQAILTVNKEKEIENSLKFAVAGVVKKCLPKFNIQTREEHEILESELTHQFTEDIKAVYMLSHCSLDGLVMTSEDKRSTIDQIIFHFAVKKTINDHSKKHLISSSQTSKFTILLSKEIKESYRMMHNSLAGITLTDDSKLWIKNKIDFSFSGGSIVRMDNELI